MAAGLMSATDAVLVRLKTARLMMRAFFEREPSWGEILWAYGALEQQEWRNTHVGVDAQYLEGMLPDG